MEKALPKKIACSSTRFFFEKVGGKQFHPKRSGCDVFTVRLQIRKNYNYSWDDVIRSLYKIDWGITFADPAACTKTNTKLVTSFRGRKPGDHEMCVLKSNVFKKALKKAPKGCKQINHDWPIKCRIGNPNV